MDTEFRHIGEMQLTPLFRMLERKLESLQRFDNAMKLQSLDATEPGLEPEARFGQLNGPMHLNYARQNRSLRKVTLKIH